MHQGRASDHRSVVEWERGSASELVNAVVFTGWGGERGPWVLTSRAGEPVSDCLCECSALRSSRCFLSSASLAFFASISSRRCAILESMLARVNVSYAAKERQWSGGC